MNYIRRTLGVMLSLAFTVSIYGQLAERTEQVSSANNKPAIISKDNCKYNGMNYRREIYDNGISVILDEQNNWFSFKTEYQVDEYTGEKMDKPISLELYLIQNGGKSRSIPIIRSHKTLNSKYDLIIEGKYLGLKYKPLGITYLLMNSKNYTISTWLWNNEHSINSLLTDMKKCKQIWGPKDNSLIDYTSLKFKDIAGEIISGGYYDMNTNIMYYGANLDLKFPFDYNGYMVRLYNPSGDVNNILMNHIKDMKSLQFKIDSLNSIAKEIEEKKNRTSIANRTQLDQLNKEAGTIYEKINNLKEQAGLVENVTAIYCIPSDEIVKVIENEKTSEIQYKNGDYAKISKLRSGMIYDCTIHRPNGIWKVKTNNNNLISEYVYTNELKRFIYKLPLKGGSLVKHLSRLDMLSLNMMKENEIFDTAKNRMVHLRGDGKIEEYVREAYEAKIAAQDAEKARKEKAAYQVLCNKYGKANVDELFNNNNIKVGMPFSMIKELCHCKIDIEGEGYKWYDVACSGCHLDEDKNVLIPNVISVFVPTKLFWIRVEDGKVTFVGHH